MNSKDFLFNRQDELFLLDNVFKSQLVTLAKEYNFLHFNSSVISKLDIYLFLLLFE